MINYFRCARIDNFSITAVCSKYRNVTLLLFKNKKVNGCKKHRKWMFSKNELTTTESKKQKYCPKCKI